MKKPRVFICYSRINSDDATRLYQDLRIAGALPWIDTADLKPGQEWHPAIRRAIRESDFVVVLLSKASVELRGFLHKEVREALEVLDECSPSTIYVIPVRLDDCRPSHDRLCDLQWLDFFPNREVGMSKLLRTVGLAPSNGWEPDELDLYIRNHVDVSTFVKDPSASEYYSVVCCEVQGGDTTYILWNDKDKILERWFIPYNGVQWDGPEKLDANDRRRVRLALGI